MQHCFITSKFNWLIGLNEKSQWIMLSTKNLLFRGLLVSRPNFWQNHAENLKFWIIFYHYWAVNEVSITVLWTTGSCCLPSLNVLTSVHFAGQQTSVGFISTFWSSLSRVGALVHSSLANDYFRRISTTFQHHLKICLLWFLHEKECNVCFIKIINL